MSIFSSILHFFMRPFLHRSLKIKIARIRKHINDEIADDFIQVLLGALRLWFKLDRKFRENINGFSARYVFRDVSGEVAASAVFSNGTMCMKTTEVPNATVTVIFDEGKSLCDFLMAPDPNIFDFILEGKLTYRGNLNYLLKLAYLAKHLRLQFMP